MINRLLKCGVTFFMMWTIMGFSGASPLLCEAAPKPEEVLKEADGCRKSLDDSSAKRKYRHNWLKCIDLYQEIHRRYPKTDQAARGLYHSARMIVRLYQYSGSQQDLDRGIEWFRTLVEEHQDHRLADDAQFRIGEIYLKDKNDPTQAYVEFLKVDIKFPKGDMRPRARAMMDKLSGIIAKKDKGEPEKKEPSSSQGGLTKVKDIRHWSTPTYTRVVIDLEKSVQYEAHLLAEDPTNQKPRRLYLDLKDAFVSSDIESSIPIRDGLLQRARAGQYQDNIVRVVLDINSISGHKIFPLHDPFRIVVDV
ncbi:MAG: AMIN domain-containing protein, partial [Pseudomonadota bacterium]